MSFHLLTGATETNQDVPNPTAIRMAPKQLGCNDTYHMMSASIENPPDCLMWLDAFAAKYDGRGSFDRSDWDRLLGHCQVRNSRKF